MFVEFCERVRIILDEATDFVHVENSKFIEERIHLFFPQLLTHSVTDYSWKTGLF